MIKDNPIPVLLTVCTAVGAYRRKESKLQELQQVFVERGRHTAKRYCRAIGEMLRPQMINVSVIVYIYTAENVQSLLLQLAAAPALS